MDSVCWRRGGDALCALRMLAGEFCLLEAMRCVLLCILEVLEALDAPEVIHCVLYVCWRLWMVGFVRWRCLRC